MTELIWVGNTLYPRWYVMLVVLSPLLTGLLIGVVIRLVIWLRRHR